MFAVLFCLWMIWAFGSWLALAGWVLYFSMGYYGQWAGARLIFVM